MSELLKNITSHPSRDLVDHWARQGRLSVKSISGALLPPWLTRFIENLEDDGEEERGGGLQGGAQKGTGTARQSATTWLSLCAT